jgi:phosphoglucosamine mutase
MSRLFGTDGVRGLANEKITAELALGLSIAAAQVLGESARALGRKPKAVVGRDPRASGEFLSAAVTAGLASAGVDVHDAGVLPTPAIAFLTADMDAHFGVMLSASHNAMPDNGIKFFAQGGHKLPDTVEDQIAARLHQDWVRPVGAEVGRVHRNKAGQARYVAHLLAALPNRLDGLTVVIDGAHGAASAVSPEVFRLAGAEVIEIGTAPTASISTTATARRILGTFGRPWSPAARTSGSPTMVMPTAASPSITPARRSTATRSWRFLPCRCRSAASWPATLSWPRSCPTSGCFRRWSAKASRSSRPGVGDRYVLEKMREGSYSLGGEQSGHVILLEHGTTGDGVLTGLMLAARVAETGKSLAELAAVMTRLPQTLINVKGVDTSRVETDEELQSAVAAESAALGDSGRVLLRKSGTEPLVRVMVEAATAEQAHDVAERLAGVVRARLAL